MPEEYIVAQGDCIESIAYAKGFFWETLWNHPDKAELKQSRKDPNVLLEGDRVVIPEREAKEEAGGTEARHRFKLKGVPSELNLVIKNCDEPRANEPYKLEIDGVLYSGTTDGEGRIKHSIPPDATGGRLLVGKEGEETEYALSLGHIDPITEISGVQARLSNLGFYAGAVDGQNGPGTEQAIRVFQSKFELPVTGQMDDATRDQLKTAYGG